MSNPQHSELKTVLITGASGGIGKSTVKRFHQAGWRIIGIDLKPFGEDFAKYGVFYSIDITDTVQLIQVFKLETEISALINNAAIQISKSILDTSIDEWDSLFRVNLRSVFSLSKLAHPCLKAAGNSAIVNVTSVHALATSTNIGSYAASKGGVLALTRAMAIEFAKDNIRVNAIAPGAVDTGMLHAGLSRGHLDNGAISTQLFQLASKTPLGRIGSPEEIANAIYFLADENQSSFMTGQVLVVDGGATARLSTE